MTKQEIALLLSQHFNCIADDVDVDSLRDRVGFYDYDVESIQFLSGDYVIFWLTNGKTYKSACLSVKEFLKGK